MQDTLPQMMPGQALARGACRMLMRVGFAPVTEFVPGPGLRADIFALGPKGELWIVECKSGLADYRSDAKWQGYLEWCDRFFWAVDAEFPAEILPEESGLVIADPYDGEILRMGAESRLPAARRTALTRRFARSGAERLRRLLDPWPQELTGGA
ncbi:MmcB family DNA repair protein [Oceanicella sp. SM1341]|uniref:MmcB family DNA repair protein n=1 Tax=Oceanicella sp. SM1341 TaxID=1548889 RepID=UPI001E4CC7F8|nr:MmcB family DNA repair protein [Oceanicella sp. SM1341]